MTTNPSISPKSTCNALANLGDAPPAVYLDMLYNYKANIDDVDTFKAATLSEISLASSAIFDHVPLSNLLHRYLLASTRLDLAAFIDTIIIFCVEQHAARDAVATAGAIIDTAHAAANSTAALRVLAELGRGLHNNEIARCADDDVLGRLSAREHSALVNNTSRFAPGAVPAGRTEYLTTRIHARTDKDLSPSAAQATLAIAPQWQGTLEDLLETARALAFGHTLREQADVPCVPDTAPKVTPATLCYELSDLAKLDLPPSAYLDVLYATQDGPATAARVPVSPFYVDIAKHIVFDRVPLSNLLQRCYHEFHHQLTHPLIDEVVRYCIVQSLHRDAVTTMGTIIDAIEAAVPRERHHLLRYFGQAVSDTAIVSCRNDDVLGRLNSHDFEELAGATVNLSAIVWPPGQTWRGDYLEERVHAHAVTDLISSATEVALAIVSEWTGTLDELLDTARTLARNARSAQLPAVLADLFT